MYKALHFVWKQLPRWLKRVLLVLGARIIGPPVLRNRVIKEGPITVAGLLRSTTGLGEGARLCLFALKKAGLDTRYLDYGKWYHWLQPIEVELGKEGSQEDGGTIIVHLNPLELAITIKLFGAKYLQHKQIIGYWAWELSVFPKEWSHGFNLVDEVWVPSGFVADSLAGHTTKAINVLPHPVCTPQPSGKTRADFHISEKKFIALMMFDMRSSAARKNPYGAMKAFTIAFGNRSDVQLILKIGTPDESESILSTITNTAAASSNIRIIYDVLSQQDQAALIMCSDVVVSLHRSEGFGLVLAEAMLLGKPVLATNYSGNTEFMDKENSLLVDYKLISAEDPQGIYDHPLAKWANPDLEQAASFLTKLADSPEFAKQVGAKARATTVVRFSVDEYIKNIDKQRSILNVTSSHSKWLSS